MTEINTSNELRGIVDITYLDRHNCKISEKNGFLSLCCTIPKKEDTLFESDKSEKFDSTEANNSLEDASEDKKKPAVTKVDLGDDKVEVTAERIFLSRAFPFDMPFEYISVLDSDKREIGFIRSLHDFEEPERTLLINELETKYYTPTIKRILSVKERYGFSYWKCECEFGEKSFTLRDTFRSIIRTHTNDGKTRIFILDVDGNRYEIPDVEALDRFSYKKIELYL